MTRLRQLLPLALLLAAPAAFSQAVRWTADSTGPGVYGDDLVAMTTDASGNVYMLGNVRNANRDIRVSKYNSAGTLVWKSDYNGSANTDDFANGFTVDAAGNVYVAGQVDGTYGAIIRLNAANGAVAWDTIETDVSAYQQVIVTSPTTVTGVGYAQSWTASIRCAKMNTSNGVKDWNVEKDTLMAFPGTQRVVMDSANNLYIGGTVDEDFWVAKLTSTGTLTWEGLFDGFQGLDEFTAMALDNTNGFVYVTGMVDVYGFDYDWDTFKINGSTGARVWEKVYNGPGSGNDRPSKIIVDGASNTIVVGECDGGLNLDVTVAKYSPTGSQLWLTSYNGPANKDDFAFDAFLDGTSNTIFVGGTATSNTRQDMLGWKLDGATGKSLWTVLNNGVDNGNDRGRAICLDSGGSVLLGGSVFKVSTNYDLRVTKYYQSTLTSSAASVPGGTAVTFTVTLNENAAANVVIPVADDSLATTVPSSVTVATGTNSKQFTMTTTAVSASTNVTVTVGALKSTVTVKAPTPLSLTLSAANIVGGGSFTGTVTLDGPAPAGGLVLACWSTTASIVPPGAVTIPEGATTATFTIATKTVAATTNGYVKVGGNGVTKTSPIFSVKP